MAETGIYFLAAARDVFAPISPDATVRMNGSVGASLLYPEVIHDGGILHFSSNFHASSPVDRARATQTAVANALNAAAERIEKTTQVLNRTIGGGIAIG